MYCITDCDDSDLLVDSNVNCIDQYGICGYKLNATRFPTPLTPNPTTNPTLFTITPSNYPSVPPTNLPSDMPTLTPTSKKSNNKSSSEDATTGIIVGITVPLAVIILVVLGYWIYKTKYKYGVIYKGSGMEIQRITDEEFGDTVR